MARARGRARAPEQLDQALLELVAHRDDGINRLGPHDQDAFIALGKGTMVSKVWRGDTTRRAYTRR